MSGRTAIDAGHGRRSGRQRLKNAPGPEPETRHRPEQSRPLLVFVFLFAKSDRENIDDRELKAFRKLAADFNQLRRTEIAELIALKELIEICHD